MTAAAGAHLPAYVFLLKVREIHMCSGLSRQ
jgi:hypothetical protein